MLPSSSPPQSPAVGVWSCGCLNWSLHCQEVQPCQMLTAPDDPFFARGVARAKLAPQGITKRHGFLELRRLVGEWEVRGCRGCQQDVYAASSSGDLLLSAQLEGDGSKLEALRASADFSPCFHIVLPARPPQGPPSTRPAAAAGQQQAEQESLSARLAVQELASHFLQQELEAMEARLRLYQEQQAQALERLRVRTGRDREALCQLLSSATAPATDVSGPASTSSSSSARQKAPGRTGREHRQREGEVFRLDGFEDDEAAFPSSEEEEEGDSDAEGAGGVSSGSSSSALDEPPMRHIAYSLPVDMPGWRLRDDDRHQQQQYAVEHDRIGADIEALARSVCDGTEMFGDLPRPRLNSTQRALF